MTQRERRILFRIGGAMVFVVMGLAIVGFWITAFFVIGVLDDGAAYRPSDWQGR